MTREEVLQDIRERFGEDILEFLDKTSTRVYIDIKAESIVRMCLYLFRNLGARFQTASGTDMPPHIEILYHFIFEDINLVISLRVWLNRENPEIASL
ncbi:MAG: hypothetical protein KAW14_01580, partial [Candidatus Aegiribacteria sp.]|nr:hypothetical protein [Candidatus Aegiribacteria sp.]